MESKWIKFEKKETKTKTSVHEVLTKEGDELLGKIKWFPRWRCYSFFPEPNTVFERTCLTDIVKFVEGLMQDRKKIKTFESFK